MAANRKCLSEQKKSKSKNKRKETTKMYGKHRLLLNVHRWLSLIAYICTYIPTCIYIHTYIYFISILIHTYIHTYICIYNAKGELIGKTHKNVSERCTAAVSRQAPKAFKRLPQTHRIHSSALEQLFSLQYKKTNPIAINEYTNILIRFSVFVCMD